MSLRLKRDTDFLAGTLHFTCFFFEEILDGMGSLEGHNLMDYSFLVAIKVGADGLDGLVKVS